MSSPRNDSIHIGGLAHEKKVRGAIAFFRGAHAWIKGVIRTPSEGMTNAVSTTFAEVGQSLYLSGLYTLFARRDMAEKYMLSGGSLALRQTGVDCLLLRVNCAQAASFAVFAAPQGSRGWHWFKNENDNQAVPMQPSGLRTLMPHNLGSSGLRPANTNGIEQQPT